MVVNLSQRHKNQFCIVKLFLIVTSILIFGHGIHHIIICDDNGSFQRVLLSVDTDYSNLNKIEYYIDDIHLFFSCDDEEKIALYTMINSIIVHHNLSSSRLFFHILVENAQKIYERELNILFMDYLRNDSIKYEVKQFSNYPNYYNFYPKYMVENTENRRICKQMNFARFYFIDIFDLDLSIVKKAIYLDVDMIVQRDIQKLYNHRVDQKIPIQSPYYPTGYHLKNHNLFNKASRHRKFVKLLNISKEIKEDKQGFNTGVYLYDLNYWNDNNLTLKYEYYVKLNYYHNGDLWSLGTQPIVNLLYIHGKIGKISRNWNVKNLGYDKKLPSSVLKRGYILHWNGADKPWTSDGYSQYKKVWLKYVPKNLNNLTISWSDNWNLSLPK